MIWDPCTWETRLLCGASVFRKTVQAILWTVWKQSVWRVIFNYEKRETVSRSESHILPIYLSQSSPWTMWELKAQKAVPVTSNRDIKGCTLIPTFSSSDVCTDLEMSDLDPVLTGCICLLFRPCASSKCFCLLIYNTALDFSDSTELHTELSPHTILSSVSSYRMYELVPWSGSNLAIWYLVIVIKDGRRSLKDLLLRQK